MKTKRTLYNLFFGIISLVIPSILGLVITSLIIQNFGSDVNGVIGTINQLVAFLVLIEGGFTLAAVVALFKPYSQKEYKNVNFILSSTKYNFLKIGFVFSLILLLLSIILPLIIDSSLGSFTISILFIIAGSNTAVSLLVESKYKVMFQASQKDYIISLIVTATSVLGSLLAILALFLDANLILVRFLIVIPALLRIGLLFYLFKKHFSWASFNEKVQPDLIKGTKDVIIQKASDMVFLNTPIIILAIFGSTVLASIYAVYNSIFLLIRSVTYSFVSAPFNGFGLLMAEGKKQHATKMFLMYEMVIISLSNVLLTVTAIMIIPFLNLYTRSFTDANYINFSIVILFVAGSIMEILHIPSRAIINVTGNFLFMRKITFWGALINISVSLILVKPLGIHGVLLGIIAGYFLLLPLTIYKAHYEIFECGIKRYLLIVLRNISLSITLIYIGVSLDLNFDSYFTLLIGACGVTIIVVISAVLINIIFDYKSFQDIYRQIKVALSKKVINK